MAASDLTSVAFLFKKLYATGTGDLAARMHPFLMRIPRRDGFAGKDFNYAIRYANPQGIVSGSANFATAQSNATGSAGVQLLMSRKSKYGIITLDGEAIAAATDQGAIIDLVTMETEGILGELGDGFAFDLFRDEIGRAHA